MNEAYFLEDEEIVLSVDPFPTGWHLSIEKSNEAAGGKLELILRFGPWTSKSEAMEEKKELSRLLTASKFGARADRYLLLLLSQLGKLAQLHKIVDRP